MSTTTATVTGNLSRDPELRYTSSGKAVASFGVAVGSRRKNAQGVWEDGETSFYDITCWDTLAENVAESLIKGARVVVTGRMQQSRWEDKDGNKRSKVEVVADDVGPSLRWATAEVTKVERSTMPATPALGGLEPGEEPFCGPADRWWPQAGIGSYPVRILP